MKKPLKEKQFLTSMRISPELHQRLKVYAAQQGISVTKWLTNLIERNLK